MPDTVLESLPKLPFSVRLHVVFRDKSSRDPAARQLLAALAGCGVLVSTTLDAAYLNATDCLKLSRPLKQFLLTCPNLLNQSVDLHLPRKGCISYAPRPVEYQGLGFSGGESPLRPLEYLNIHEYPCGGGGNVRPLRLPLPRLSRPGPRDGLQAANFSWSTLQRLG